MSDAPNTPAGSRQFEGGVLWYWSVDIDPPILTDGDSTILARIDG